MTYKLWLHIEAATDDDRHLDLMDFFGLAIELDSSPDLDSAEDTALNVVSGTNATPDDIHRLFKLLREQQEDVYEAAQ